MTAGPDGAVWFTNSYLGANENGSIGRITTTVTPQITGFTPTSGSPRTTVTITGINLAGATRVTFNGTTAAIASDTATQVTANVPTGATTGPITVTVPAGTATSKTSFTAT
jgi:uncharacterized protein (TIGR03437 family)